MMAGETAVLTSVQTRGIYEGRFKDHSPYLRAAGKFTYAPGDSTQQCLKTPDRPCSPDIIRRFRASAQPAAGKSRVFYGRAQDPHRYWANSMTHGVTSDPSILAGDLLNPRPKSNYQQAMIDRKESSYISNQRAPLGMSHDQRPGLPNHIDPLRHQFGIATEKFGTSGELVSPPKSRVQVNQEAEVGLDLYKRTHNNFKPGEQNTRNYIHPSYKQYSRFGIPTPHDNAGKEVRRVMAWQHDTMSDKRAPIVSQRVDDFRERTQPQLGKVHDPIADTLLVGPDHTFGVMLKPDEYGVGDLMHNRVPRNYLRGKDRMRGVVAAIRQHLKKANFHNFTNILQAFKHYDKNGSGRISLKELQDVCVQFNLPAEPELIRQVMEFCDIDCDGQISYTEFANFLNWKDKLPSGLPHSAPQMLNNQEMSRRTTPETLEKQIDAAIGGHRTSTSMINAIVGGINTTNYRKYGIPTVRTDLAAPHVRRISDRTNYGDESDAYGLLSPSLFSLRGVHEKDLLIPRSQHDLFDIFSTIGGKITRDDFEKLYQLVAAQHPLGHVSVEGMRSIMDQVQVNQM